MKNQKKILKFRKVNGQRFYSSDDLTESLVGALVRLEDYVGSAGKYGFLDDQRFLSLRDQAIDSLSQLDKRRDVAEESIGIYWRIYAGMITRAVNKNYELEAEVLNRRAMQMNPVTGKDSLYSPDRIRGGNGNHKHDYGEKLRARAPKVITRRIPGAI